MPTASTANSALFHIRGLLADIDPLSPSRKPCFSFTFICPSRSDLRLQAPTLRFVPYGTKWYHNITRRRLSRRGHMSALLAEIFKMEGSRFHSLAIVWYHCV